MNYRLTYDSVAGFNYTGFNTEKEAMLWAAHQERLGLIKALKLLKYDAGEDMYKEIADLGDKPVEIDLPRAGQNIEYCVSYKQNNVFQTILVEAPSVRAAERYFASKKPTARIVGSREATADDFKPGIPVLALTEREEKKLRDDLLSSDIEELDLSVRAYNSLRRGGVLKVRELVCMTEDELKKLPNLGWKGLDEIKTVLAAHGERLLFSSELEVGKASRPCLGHLIAAAERKRNAAASGPAAEVETPEKEGSKAKGQKHEIG